MIRRLAYLHVATLSRPWWKIWQREIETKIVLDREFEWHGYQVQKSERVSRVEFHDFENGTAWPAQETKELIPIVIPLTYPKGYTFRFRARFSWLPTVQGVAVALFGYVMEREA